MKASDRPFADSGSDGDRELFIASLTHDGSRKNGDAVIALFLQKPGDRDFSPACLRCLANRGFEDFLIDRLEKIQAQVSKPNALHTRYIEAIGTSRAPAVREQLLNIVKHAGNEDYFMAGVPTIDRSHDGLLIALMRDLLSKLPDDTKDGRHLLKLVGERIPNEARQIYKSFLENGSANRAETMCRVLWHANPMSKDILAPLLDDQRELPGFTIAMRICDRAAQAISHTSKDIRFDSDWSLKKKDAQIEKLKQYCAGNAK